MKSEGRLGSVVLRSLDQLRYLSPTGSASKERSQGKPINRQQVEKEDRVPVIYSLVNEIAESGAYCTMGRIQKGAYLLQELLDAPFGYNFYLDLSGPVSSDVKSDLNQLVFAGVLEPGLSPTRRSTVFVPKPLREPMKEAFEESSIKWNAKIQVILPILSREITELERVTTALYLSRKDIQPKGSKIDTADWLVKLRPQVTPQDAKSAVIEAKKVATSLTIPRT